MFVRILAATWVSLPLFAAPALLFESNSGQAPAEIEFIGRGPRLLTYFTSTETIFSLKGDAIRMRLSGSRANAGLSAADASGARIHYHRGNDPSRWNRSSLLYRRLWRRGVYPGIDAVYYERDGRVEFDFHVAPGADPGRIEITYDGRVRMLADGGIAVTGGSAELIQHAPETYQVIEGRRVPVESKAVLRANRITFQTGTYDRSKPLIIDPVVTFSTTIGANGLDTVTRAVAGTGGRVYVAGTTDSAASAPFRIAPDVIVWSFRAEGTLIRADIFGGDGDDTPLGLAADPAGALYIAGTTTSTNMGLNGSYRSTPYGGSDAFLIKTTIPASSNGAINTTYQTYFGGDRTDEGTGVAVDGAGAAYLTGSTQSGNLPVQFAYQTQIASNFDDGFVVKFTPTGSSLVYSTYLGGSHGSERPTGIALGSDLAAYIVGRTTSDNLPLTSPLQNVRRGSSDLFVAKINPFSSGTLSVGYVTYFGGNGNETSGDIAADAIGGVYVTGTTFSTDYPTSNAYLAFPNGCAISGCAVATKLGVNGQQIAYSTSLSNTAGSTGADIDVDGAGTAYIVGSTGAGFPIVNPLIGFPAPGAGLNAFAVILNSAGNSVSLSAVLGGALDDTGTALARDSAALWVAGTTLSTGYPTVSPSQQPTAPSSGFLTRISLGTGPRTTTITRPNSSETTIFTTGVTIEWDRVPDSTGYQLQVKRDPAGPGFTGPSVLFSGNLSGVRSTSTLVDLPEGSFIASVRSCLGGFSDADCGPFATRSFAVAPPKPAGPGPVITSPANNAVLTTSTHTIQWQDTGATSYEVRVLRGAEVELYFRVSAPGTSTIYSFRSGTYTASVRACLAICGDWPAPITFTVNLPPAGTTPPVISSAVVNGGNSVTVNWNAITGADLYLVQAVQPAPAGPGGGALTVASTRTSSTSAVLPVPAGAAFVFVAACNGDGCQGNSAPFPINPAGPNPASPSVGSPAGGSSVNGPVVLISWSRIPGDNGSNTTYRLYVQDMGRQKPALDVLTKSNFYGAYFSPGTRYDIVVIANPGSQSQLQGPASGFSVRGTAPQHATLTTPTHESTLAGVDSVSIGWTPLQDSSIYQYFVSQSGVPENAFGGITAGARVDLPLTPGLYNAIVRACSSGSTCSADSDSGWLPWSNSPGGSGIVAFTIQ